MVPTNIKLCSVLTNMMRCTQIAPDIIPALEGTRPIRQKPYRHGLIQEDEIEKQVKVKEHGFVEKGLGAKLRPKYVGSHAITKSLPCQVYEIKRDGKTSVQHEGGVRLYVSEESVDNSQEQVEAVECESFQPARKHHQSANTSEKRPCKPVPSSLADSGTESSF